MHKHAVTERFKVPSSFTDQLKSKLKNGTANAANQSTPKMILYTSIQCKTMSVVAQ
jgi:hypothetical protein